MQDRRLLRRYVEEGSQEAFGALVARHLGFVYAVCRREVGDATLAEDAAQVVFLLLARKAKTIRPSVTLSTWLFQVARLTGKNIRRQEARRRASESRMVQEGAGMGCDSSEWEDAEPFLNDALACLSGADREAVLLRYWGEHSFAEAGAALGISEEAARKRVTRALDKMRRYLTAQGAAMTGTAALAGLLSAEAARSAPPAVQAAVLQTAAGALPTASKILTLAEGVTRTMGTIKALGVATCACAVLVGVYGGAATVRAFSTSKSRAGAAHSLKTVPAPIRARTARGASKMPAVQQIENLRLAGDFTLRYTAVITDIRTPLHRAAEMELARLTYQWMLKSGSKEESAKIIYDGLAAHAKTVEPPKTATMVLSSHDGRLLYQYDDSTQLRRAVYDGTRTVVFQQFKTSSQRQASAEIRPHGDGLCYYLPLSGVSLPGIPLIQSPALAASSAQTSVFSGTVLLGGSNVRAFVKGRLNVEMQGGRLQAQTLASYDDGVPSQLWAFSQPRLFQDHWLPSRIRLTEYGAQKIANTTAGQNRAPAETCDYSLQEATSTPLDASAFDVTQSLQKGDQVTDFTGGVPKSYRYDPAQGGLGIPSL